LHRVGPSCRDRPGRMGRPAGGPSRVSYGIHMNCKSAMLANAIFYCQTRDGSGSMAEVPVFIGLGSNLGDRAGALAGALTALAGAGIEPVLRSSIYRSEPVEVVDQDEFLNQVAGCVTARSPEEILEVCLAVERGMGRVRTRRGGPRNIDLDLLLC